MLLIIKSEKIIWLKNVVRFQKIALKNEIQHKYMHLFLTHDISFVSFCNILIIFCIEGKLTYYIPQLGGEEGL